MRSEESKRLDRSFAAAMSAFAVLVTLTIFNVGYWAGTETIMKLINGSHDMRFILGLVSGVFIGASLGIILACCLLTAGKGK